MSKIPLPDAATVPDYAAIRLAWLTRYCELKEIELSDLNDNDPIVRGLEAGAYLEMLRISSNNDSVRQTMLASAFGEGLDDLGADPLYGGLERLVTEPGRRRSGAADPADVWRPTTPIARGSPSRPPRCRSPGRRVRTRRSPWAHTATCSTCGSRRPTRARCSSRCFTTPSTARPCWPRSRPPSTTRRSARSATA